MIIRKLLSLALMLGLLGTGYVCAQQPQSAGSVPPAGVEKLGKVNFPTSCDPKVQARVRARRGDAAFVLVSGRPQDVSRSAAGGSVVLDCILGHRCEPAT